MEDFFIENFSFDSFAFGLFIFIMILLFFVLTYLITLYVFQGISLMNLAKKNNIPNPWLAWLPAANMYILGKLGFELYAPHEKRNEIFTWILFGCSMGSIVLSSSGLSPILTLAVVVFSTWAYYYIFAKINPDNSILFAILIAIFGIGGLLLFFNRNRFNNGNVNVPSKEESVVDSENTKSKFCSCCGNKLNKNSKFCSKCGNKIQ